MDNNCTCFYRATWNRWNGVGWEIKRYDPDCPEHSEDRLTRARQQVTMTFEDGI